MARRPTARPPSPPDQAREAVDAILAESGTERLVWFPVKHYSPACGHHLAQLIRRLRPVCVLVEGPDDANDLIPFIVDDESRPPLTILSTYVDQKNTFGLNGVLSSSPNVPARYRGWWPVVAYAPEYIALREGSAIGATVAFIDAPLRATIPYYHVPRRQLARSVSDRQLAENAYFEALQKHQRRRSFEELWQATFEVGGFGLSSEAFRRAVLTFAWCARHVGIRGETEATADGAEPSRHPDVEAGNAEREPAGEGGRVDALQATGTLLREAHMRWHIDRQRKAHPEGRLLIVTGAYHTVALPWTRGRRAKAKADRYTETVLTAHSYRALAALYHQNRLPGYGHRLWEHIRAGSQEPFNSSAMQLLIEIMRRARQEGAVLSTADAVGAYQAARNLATLRDNREITVHDLLDAVQMTYIKGDVHLMGSEVERAARAVLVGGALGRVTPAAGQVPLMRDFYAQCRSHRLDVSGKKKVVRCDVHKREAHRLKSAFLHQCELLEVPIFQRIDDARRGWRRAGAADHYRGPDPVTGENMHLITETWGIQWIEAVDDRLLELSDRGATVAQAARSLLVERLEGARGDAAETTKLLLRSAQMMLLETFDEVLGAVEDAIETDMSFGHLVGALDDFIVLHSYRDALATQGRGRLLKTIARLFVKACLVLPSLANTDEERVNSRLDRLQALVRIALTFEAVDFDRQLLVGKLRQLVGDSDGVAAVRGAGFGILYALGATREKVVAAELDSYLLGSPKRVLQAGDFLDGLFLTAKSIFMGRRRLLRAINRVLAELDWSTFKTLLPDLRRAFTQFIPAEIDAISAQVAEEIGLDHPPDGEAPVPEEMRRRLAEADRRVAELLEEWL